ncbi:MAG: alpha-L-arabinofuranosidase C-terminal domain-containing protein [Arenicella sp.]
MIQRFYKTIFLLAPLFITLSACKEENNLPPVDPDQTFEISLQIDLEKSRPVNRNLLGNNVQWVDNGDELIDQKTLEFKYDKVAKARKLGISVLRYPGGSLADLYHWQDGLGSLDQRKNNSRFHGKGQDSIRFGTTEFLTLTRTLNAEPMITVNVITGSAEEAADWVKQTNITRLRDAEGELLPKVKYWEIGNEPYLIDDNQKHLAIMPEDFANKANEFIKKMKQVDPSIIVGIPLRSDMIAGSPATPIQGYNHRLLGSIKAEFDYVSLHNAYFPFIPGKAPEISDLYHATLAGSQYVMEDIRATQQQLKTFFPNRKPLIAITEYSPFFTIGKGKSDGYIASLLGALYIADLLTTFANSNDVWMANYWSLAGNWFFGAIRQDGKLRPSYHVLEGFNRVLQGEVLSSHVKTASFTNPKAGFVVKQSDIPFASAVATRQGDTLTILVLNKHYSQSAKLNLNLSPNKTLTKISQQTLSSDKAVSADNVSIKGWSDTQAGLPDSIPARSLMIVRAKIK